MLLNTAEGEALLPVFSIRHELAKWPFAKGETEALPFALLRHIVIKNGTEFGGLLIDSFGTPRSCAGRNL
ncbi:MAG TPA: hypothetical protein VN512_03495 [Clostridia bacterium]|nr:hypothetical protein [Clostridia bacterium]